MLCRCSVYNGFLHCIWQAAKLSKHNHNKCDIQQEFKLLLFAFVSPPTEKKEVKNTLLVTFLNIYFHKNLEVYFSLSGKVMKHHRN